MSCNICCENFKSTRPKICCQYCDFEACRACCEKYVLSEEIPKCMEPSCAKEWSRKFLRETFTNNFLTSVYKEHIETILFDKEKALLPATQPLVEEKVRVKNIKKEMREIDNLINDLYKQKKQLEHRLYNRGNDDYNVKEEEKGHRFVRQCPADGCRGFLSTQWKCGLCEKWTCPDCHELKGFNRDCEHTCDPNSVATAKLLSSDSKPCPKCQCLIFKIEGCDQMWCTQCRTAFSWKTGRLETHIHNPHYYEWQRKNNGGVAPRVAGDVECGRGLNNNLSIVHVVAKHTNLYKIDTGNYSRIGRQIYEYDPRIDQISHTIRNMIHNNEVELPTFRTDYFEKNQELRIKYMEGLIGEDVFKILVQRNDKKNRKNTEISQIITLCNTAVTDIIYRLHTYIKNSRPNEYSEFDKYMIELQEIRNYCNNILREIAFTYNCLHYEFTLDFEFKKAINIKEANGKPSKKESQHKEEEDEEEEFIVINVKNKK